MSAFLLSFAVIFVAELGDKSQLMAMAFATRYRFWTVVGAITAATTLVHLLSVAIGHVLGAELPTTLIKIVAGLAFVGFALWTLRGDALSVEDQERAAKTSWSAFLTVATAFFLAELGDKTMLATITLATTSDWFGTWIGSTIGMVAADALAIGVGIWLGRTLPANVIRLGAATLFFAFGAWMVAEALLT